MAGEQLTRAQLVELIAQREQEQSPSSSELLNTAKAGLGGAQAGAAGLAGLPLEIANLPNALSNYLAGVSEPSPTQALREQIGIPAEPRSGPGQFAYNFMEGATPAAAITGAATLNPLAAAGAGLLGGVTNVAAKYYAPESPVAQTLFGLLPAGVAGLANMARTRVPKVPTASELPETGMTATAGQRTGSQALLRTEANVAATPEGQPIFKQAGLANASSAEDFANKMLNFAKNPNLTVSQIAQGASDAMSYMNNRILNKFRVDNRRNFNEAKVEAGDARLFDTTNVNQTLDNAIQLYGAETMPPELQAFASKLKTVKNNLSQQAEPSTILNAEGKPAVIIPEQTVKLTIDELQKNLESWGKAAKTGSYSSDGVNLGDVATGTLKKLSRDVLNAFRNDLDAANLQGVAGAEKLIAAREGFKKGLQDVNDFQNQSLVKFFGDVKDPTAVVERLQNASPTERVTMFKVLESSRPDVLDSLRARSLDGLIQSSAGDLNKLLGGLKDVLKQKSETGAINTNDFLFQTPVEKAKANVLVRDLETVTRKAEIPKEPSSALSRTTGEAAGTTMGYRARLAFNTVQDAIDAISGSVSSPEKLAWMMTNPQGQSLIREAARMKAGQKLSTQMKSAVDYLASDALIGGTVSAVAQTQGREAGQAVQAPQTYTATPAEIQQRIKELEQAQ
jgi:hypothetical protein